MNTFENAVWRAVILPDDGARGSQLTYRDMDLLTSYPTSFRPLPDIGAYETRPVYGYDDCFPSVDKGRHPALGIPLPDHGMCWSQSATVTEHSDGLEAVFDCPALNARLMRRMIFDQDTLVWRFTITNRAEQELSCQHVMHPLMPPAIIEAMTLPPCKQILDGLRKQVLPSDTPLARDLISMPSGQCRLYSLQGIEQGEVQLHFRNRITLLIAFPKELFPTVNIWWNREGYPVPGSCVRDEFAIEPMPGPTGCLEAAYRHGTALRVPAHGVLTWDIVWQLAEGLSASKVAL